jgi:LEA14-like dessication related protein
MVVMGLLASCKDIKDPELKGIDNVKLNKLTSKQSTVTMQIKYFNPNHFKAKIKQAEGEAWMDSSYLGHFTVDSIVNVPAYSEFIVPVSLAVDMKYLLLNSLSAFLNDEVLIRIKGTARAGRSGFYKTIPLRYEGKQDLGRLLKQ